MHLADIAFSFGIVHYPARGVYRRTSRDSRVMFMSHGCTYCRRPVPSRRHFSHRPLNMQRTDARAAKLERQRRENRAPGAATCRARLLPQGRRAPGQVVGGVAAGDVSMIGRCSVDPLMLSLATAVETRGRCRRLLPRSWGEISQRRRRDASAPCRVLLSLLRRRVVCRDTDRQLVFDPQSLPCPSVQTVVAVD
jgi:hypothetical protein